MSEGPPEIGSEYSSRSELNRCLLALSLVFLVIASAAHIASYFGIVVVQNRVLQEALTWLLVVPALWKALLDRNTAAGVPRPWSIAMGLAWLNASALVAFSPVIGQTYSWPRMARWLGLDGVGLLLVHARVSSALQVAAALSLFVSLWFRPGNPLHNAEALDKIGSICSHRVGRLAAFGIALPMGIIVACNLLRNRNWGDAGATLWIAIIAGFWWIAGVIVTGVYLIRDAIRRDG
jgi:hypothetical protein